MNLIERVKNILITPKTEWNVIDGEVATPPSLLTTYVLPLAVIAALGSVIRGLLFAASFGGFGIKYFILTAVIGFIAAVIAFYISTYIVDMLATSFGSEKNLGKSAQLVAYSNTPSYIASLLSFIPIIGWLIGIAGWVYTVYLMYLGVGPIKKTPEDKKVLYVLVAIVINIAVYFIIAAVLGAILFAVMGAGIMAVASSGAM